MNQKKTGKIAYSLYAINFLPLLFFGVLIAILGYYLFQQSLYRQIRQELQHVAETTNLLIDSTWPGDYQLSEDPNIPGGLLLYKGDTNITFQYDLLDEVKASTGLDLTLFCQDTRILTTLMDPHEVRYFATGAAPLIVNEVYRGGEAHFYPNALIDKRSYCCYYMPISNSDGSVIGMLAVGKSSDEVNADVRRTVLPLVLVDLLVMLFLAVLIIAYTSRLNGTLRKIHIFLQEASGENVDVDLDPAVLRRNDELGEIGTSILSMHRSLRDMMEMDPLTQISNRRSADRKIKKLLLGARHGERTVCLSIGDIDYFKKVNDTYGHEAGDDVLRAVADALTEHMNKLGFAARWGGEEFLVVFQNMELEQAEKSLNELRERIGQMVVNSDDQLIRMTMSFGIVQWSPDLSADDLVKKADERLYFAKENGRNRVVALLPDEDPDAEPAVDLSSLPSDTVLTVDPSEADALLRSAAPADTSAESDADSGADAPEDPGPESPAEPGAEPDTPSDQAES